MKVASYPRPSRVASLAPNSGSAHGTAPNSAHRCVKAFRASLILLGIIAFCIGSVAGAQLVAHYGVQTDVDTTFVNPEFTGTAVDAAGNVYVVDSGTKSAYKESPNADGTYTRSLVTSGLSYAPGQLAVDAAGNVYIADQIAGKILKETPSGSTYIQTVLSTTILAPYGIAVDGNGNVFVSWPNNNQVFILKPSGSTYVQSVAVGTGLSNPIALATDTNGNLYIQNSNNGNILVETPFSGVYSLSNTITLNGDSASQCLAVDVAGNIYVCGYTSHSSNADTGNYMYRLTPNGLTYYQSQIGDGLNAPSGVAVDPAGNVYISVQSNFSSAPAVALLKLSVPQVNFGTVNMGTRSGAMALTFTIDRNGINLIQPGIPKTYSITGQDFADAGTGTCTTNGTTHNYKSGDTCTVNITFNPQAAGARNGSVQLFQATTALATAYFSGTGAGPQIEFGTATQTTVLSTGLSNPGGVAVDGAGNLYVADTGNNRLLLETGTPGSYTQTILSTTPLNGSGLSSPAEVALDSSNLIYVSDPGNNRAVQYSPSGVYYIPQASGSGLTKSTGIAVDNLGNTYIADTANNRILEEVILGANNYGLINGSSVQYLLPMSELSSPSSIAVDGSGNLYIADTGNNRVLKETYEPLGQITDVGVYQESTIGSGLSSPSGVAVDEQGNVYISDTGNNRVLKETVSYQEVSAGSRHSAYEQAVYTQSVLSTAVSAPLGLSADSTGGIYVADSGNNRIVKIGYGPPPTLTFATTAVGATSSDSPQTVTVANIGTSTILFPVPTMGNNPSISTNFSFSSTGSGACPLLGGLSSSNGTLQPGSTCTLPISFSPTTSGSITGSLVLTDNNLNAANATQTIPLNGTATGAATLTATLTPGSAAFGSQTVNTTSTAQSFVLTNTGTSALTISGIALIGTNPTNFAVSTSGTTCGSTLAASATCTIAVTFTPSSATTYSATLTVSDNATGSTQTATLTGTGTTAAAPIATLTPATVAFGTQTVNTTSAVQTVTLSNTGNAPLTVSSIALGGANSGNFSIGTTCGSTLAASATCAITLTFTPPSAATFAATLTVTDNSAITTQSTTLTGTGTAAAAPIATLTPSAITFASQTVGTTSAAQILTLANTGTASLTISGITLAGANPTNFATTSTCGATLAASATCTIAVTFTPSSAASFAATLSVADNSTGSPQTATLTGTGTAAAAPAATLTASSAFSNQTVATSSAPQILTLTNTGNATLTISGITLAGANPTNFAINAAGTTCGTTLAAAASCSVAVTFTPTSAATFAATLSVADNAANSTQTSSLTGTGIAAVSTATFALTATPPSQTINPGGTAQYTVTVTSVGGTFSTPVSLSVQGLPALAVATFSTLTVTPGAAGASATLTIQTAPEVGALDGHPQPGGTSSGDRHTAWVALLLLPLMAGARKRLGKRSSPWLAALLLTMVSLGLTACAGGYFGPPPQTYTVTITGTGSAPAQTTTVTLTVQ